MRHSAAAVVVLCACLAPAAALTGSVTTQDGEPIPHAFVGLLDASWQLAAHSATSTTGAFDLELDAPPEDGARLIVQPPGHERPNGLGAYAHPPRAYAVAGLTQADIVLPPAGAIVLHAYDPAGNLLRWADFERRGMFGANFLYWTDPDDRMREASIWPVHDAVSRAEGNPREMGLPGIMAAPGSRGVVQVMYWETPGQGKLLLRADDGGLGFVVPAPGETRIIALNVELARTAVAGHARRVRVLQESSRATGWLSGHAALAGRYGERLHAILGIADPIEAAARADELLADALEAREALEVSVAYARNTRRRPEFSFGVFQGGQYQPEPYQLARQAGFDLATVLIGWAWSDLSGQTMNPNMVDLLFGFSALAEQGYTIKTHGGIWLQEYGILPERTRAMSNEELHRGFLAQQRAMLDAFGRGIPLWEAMNEPAATNEQGFSRDEINALLAESAQQLKDAGRTTLVNSGIESNFGNKYQLYRLDNEPVDGVVLNYLEALEHARDAGALDAIDIIGIQFYPGARNADRLGGINAPMMTLGWLVDTLDRYATLGKPIHITEFSVPARYDDGWTSGYWRAPWTESMQADYAEAVFMVAYAHPSVESITWWDITDAESSVISGGLLTETGEAKPVFERLRRWMARMNALPDAAE